MAISPFQPLLLLLASLLFLPALHAVNFWSCNKVGYAYGNITRVDISPNPVELNDDPTITFLGFVNNSSSNIYRGKILVQTFRPIPFGPPMPDHTLATKEFDENNGGIIEHGKNFELSILVPSSEANKGNRLVRVSLLDYGIYEGPQEKLCFGMYFPSTYHPMTSS